MAKKHPTWNRTRVGKNRVHWVAYDDTPGTADCTTIDQGYAPSLVEADAAARAALSAAGIYQARRMSRGFGRRPAPRAGAEDAAPPPKAPKPARVERPRPREYLYTRHEDDHDPRPWVAAHLVVKRTARRVYVSRRSIGPDQVGTEDEAWGPDEAKVSLDRAALIADGSAFAGSYRQSAFYQSRDAALGDAGEPRLAAYEALGIGPPCTVGEIKEAYRRRAREAHPDRGGSPDDFRAIEAAYRRLLREAQAPEA